MSKQRAVRLVLVLLACMVVGGSTGCLGVMGPTLGMWMDVKGPIQGGSGSGSKTGEACSESWFGVVALGDASLEAAARNGGITRIDSADFHATNQIVYGRFCTTVRGS